MAEVSARLANHLSLKSVSGSAVPARLMIGPLVRCRRYLSSQNDRTVIRVRGTQRPLDRPTPRRGDSQRHAADCWRSSDDGQLYRNLRLACLEEPIAQRSNALHYPPSAESLTIIPGGSSDMRSTISHAVAKKINSSVLSSQAWRSVLETAVQSSIRSHLGTDSIVLHVAKVINGRPCSEGIFAPSATTGLNSSVCEDEQRQRCPEPEYIVAPITRLESFPWRRLWMNGPACLNRATGQR